MKKVLVSIALIFLYGTVIAQDSTRALTLRQCIETGLANNLNVLQAVLQTKSDKLGVDQSKLNLLPNLNGSAGYDFNQGRSIDPFTNSRVNEAIRSANLGLTSNVVLFNGLAMQNSIKQNSLTYEASKMDLQQAKDNLTIDIILDYLQVLSAFDQLTQARNQADLSSSEVKRLEALNQQGAVRPSDLTDLQGSYASDKLTIIASENALENAKIALFQLMSVPYKKEVTFEKIDQSSFTEKYQTTRDEIYQTALKQLALIKSVDLKRQSAAKGVKVQQGLLFPVLSFGGNLGTNYSSIALQNQFVNTTYIPTADSALVNNAKYPVYRFHDNFTPSTQIPFRDQLSNNISTAYGFSLTIPLFNSFAQRNRVKQAKINLQSADLIAKNTRTQVGQAIDQNYINMVSASDRYKVLLEQVQAFTESFSAAETRFNNGVGTSDDYLLAKTRADQANLNLINAKYDYFLRTKILDYYQGKQLW